MGMTAKLMKKTCECKNKNVRKRKILGMFRPRVSMPSSMNSFDALIQPLNYEIQYQNNGMIPNGFENQFSSNPLMAVIHRNLIKKSSCIDGFGEASTLWENDLQSVVKMALGQDQHQGFHGQMKDEVINFLCFEICSDC